MSCYSTRKHIFCTACAQLVNTYTKKDQLMTDDNWFHDPVLKKEILDFLLFPGVETVFDGTLGLGGHAALILEAFPEVKHYVACDLDENHLLFAQKRLSKWKDKLDLHRVNFSQLKLLLDGIEDRGPLAILLDLGLCSAHVDEAEKGFSFQGDGPLNLCFDTSSKTNAQTWINKASRSDITRVLRKYGELSIAPQLAKKIMEFRKEKPLETTGELKGIIESVAHPQNRRKALTLTFQAIRMVVNDELDVIDKALEGAFQIMQPGDRMGVISYHSLEDRVVKQFFAMNAKPVTEETAFSLHEEVAPPAVKLLSKKPYEASAKEVEANPRSRSAKLRIIEKM